MKRKILLFLAAAALTLNAQAADVAISALPAGTTLTGTEPIPAVQSGATVRTAPNALSTFTLGQMTSTTITGKFTGTCSSSTYLRGDGSCNTPTGSVTSVGLTAPTGLTVTGSPVTGSGSLGLTTTLNGPMRGNGSGFITGSTALGSEVSGTLPVGNGGSGAVTLTGLLKGNGTSAFTVGANSDVISLWTGTCSSSTFLRGDGSCTTPAGAGTVTSVGLTMPTGFTVGSSPVTGSGTIAVTTSLSGVLHGAAGAFTAGAVSLTADVSGTLPVANGGIGVGTLTGLAKGNGTSAFSAAANADIIGLWTGTCSSSTFLRGDGSCQSPAGSGTVTSVAFSVPGSSIFGATGTPVTGSGTLGLTTTGTSGGIPYFSSTSALSTSAALAAGQVVLGGGSGVAPSTLGSNGTSGQLLTAVTGAPPSWQSGIAITALPVSTGVASTDLLIDYSQADTQVEAPTVAQLGAAVLGNGFIAFTGPTTSTKTFTLPNASSTILTSNAAVTAVQGGTGQTAFTVGDIFYADTTTTIAKLNDAATGNVLNAGGAGVAPSWGKVNLATSITNRIAVGNGGTNLGTPWARSGYAASASCNNATAAAAWNLPTSGAPTPACIGTTTTDGTLDYADAVTSTATINVMRLPVGWTSTVDLNVDYTGSTSSTNNFTIQASTACVATGSDLIAPTYNTATSSTTPGPTTAGQRGSLAFTSIDVTNCAAGSVLFIKLARLGADAGDTNTGNFRLLGVETVIRVTPQA